MVVGYSKKASKIYRVDRTEKIEGGKKTLLSIIMVSIAFLFPGALTFYAIRDIETAASDFTGLGVVAIPAIVIYATLHG